MPVSGHVMLQAMTTTPDAVQMVAVVAATGLGVVALFQVAIAFGAPVGRASWGGTHEGVLPRNLRAASAIAAVVWTLAALVILGRADLGPLSGGFTHWAAWVLVGVLALGSVMNAASKSRWERYGWAPFTMTLAVLCAVVAAS